MLVIKNKVMDIIKKHIKKENELPLKTPVDHKAVGDIDPPGSRDHGNDPRIIVAERKNKLNKDIHKPPGIGDKVYFEVTDELHENNVRMVHAKILRQYPKKMGKCCEYLAFDCIDLDKDNLFYTVAYDQKFIKTDTG